MNNKNNQKQWQLAKWLAFITIFYNIIEGVISIFFGVQDDTLALLGFGVDSLVEVISGAGILHMILRIQRAKDPLDPKFEKLALKITGTGFYLLTAGLVAGSVIKIINNSKPETTVAGIIISSISLLTMYILIRLKLKVGCRLNSSAIIADANCTKTCFYLSGVLLLSSGLYELFRITYIDIAGALLIAFFAFKEGKEAFEKT